MGIASAIIGGGALLGSALLGKKSGDRQAEAARDARGIYQMTPEEKRAFFSEGLTKINQGFRGSMDLSTRSLSQRGLGGNALASPIANIGRSRATSIGDLYSNLVKTAMNMRAGTPSAVASASGSSPSFLEHLGGSILPPISSAAGTAIGAKFGKMFG